MWRKRPLPEPVSIDLDPADGASVYAPEAQLALPTSSTGIPEREHVTLAPPPSIKVAPSGAKPCTGAPPAAWRPCLRPRRVCEGVAELLIAVLPRATSPAPIRRGGSASAYPPRAQERLDRGRSTPGDPDAEDDGAQPRDCVRERRALGGPLVAEETAA